jgi:predicted AAA+ superfamily ATPase
MTLNEFPLGNQTFAEIFKDKLFYADKTKYIYDLVKATERNYFLSRPRRFGKTLLLSTIEELFTNGRTCFEELWIGKSDYDFPIHPVLFLSLSVDSDDSEALKTDILSELKKSSR